MANSEAEANRRAVIKNVERVVAEAEHLGEMLSQLGQVIEAVLESRSVRRVGETEARQIRRYYVIAIGKRGNKLPVHVRGGWKPVQQQQHGRLSGPGFTVKEAQATDVDGPIVCSRHDRN